MDIHAFEESLAASEPPTGLPALAEALWWEAHGKWERAHEIAQEVETLEGAWVHAYLHRREGDAANARYWYRRAGRPVSREAFEQERRAIVAELLS